MLYKTVFVLLLIFSMYIIGKILEEMLQACMSINYV